MKWAEGRGLELASITPKDVGQYMDGLKDENTSMATRKQHLAALRHYFDGLVTRHAIILNPALSVRGERYEVVEGKTPEITVDGARTLLKSIGTDTAVELRDRAIIAILIYTAARAGAVASLKRGSFYHAGDQRMLHFDEKNGKSREIPVRHDLERRSLRIYRRGRPRDARKDTPLFRTAYRKTGQLTKNPHARDRHLPDGEAPAKDAGLPRACRRTRSGSRPSPTFGTGRAARRRPAPGRPCRPADHPALRPPRQEDHPQHRGADLDLKFRHTAQYS